MKGFLAFVALIVLSLAAACGNDESRGPLKRQTTVHRQLFGKTPEGASVNLYTLSNAKGSTARITNYGGILVSLSVPDRKGRLADVVLGFDGLEPYLSHPPYFGAIIGRYGNRIAKARFVLDGVEYALAPNDGDNHLHGGLKGFDKVLWQPRVVRDGSAEALRLEVLSKDREEGYPGNLAVEVTYRLMSDNALRIDYRATTDKKTVVNLTHHSYFNLLDGGASDILGHELMIRADRFTPVDEELIPTGEVRSVQGTPMDFTRPVPIGARVDSDDEQLRFAGGYDHNWILNHSDGTLALAARVVEPTTGRILEVYTTEPGLQFYSGNFLDGSLVGKGGVVYGHRAGFCLEAQHFPDSPNKPQFPSTVLGPGAVYRQTTIYRFSAK